MARAGGGRGNIEDEEDEEEEEEDEMENMETVILMGKVTVLMMQVSVQC